MNTIGGGSYIFYFGIILLITVRMIHSKLLYVASVEMAM